MHALNNNTFTTIYIIRHGESEGNAQGILQGQSDYPLTKIGEEQAKQFAKDLHQIKFDAVFASDLLRAKRTAEIIAIEHQLVVKTTEALRERNYGSLQGKDTKNFTEEIGKLFDDWNALTDREWLSHRIVHNAETGEEMSTRFLLFLRELGVGYKGKTILVVSHGDMMRNLLVHLGWGDHIELRGKTIGNTAYIKLETDGVDFFVKETKGIIKNQSTHFSWQGQGNS